MKRRFFLLAVLLGAVAVSGPASGVDFHVKPYLQNVTRSSITIMWETKSKEDSTVQYGPGSSYTKKVHHPVQVKIHKVQIQRLKENMKYIYRVGSETGTFKTAPKPGTSFTYALLGDTRRWGSGKRSSWYKYGFDKHFMQWGIVLCLDTGDLVVDGTKYSQWGKDYFPRFEQAMRHIPFYPSRGNHEKKTDTKDADNWFKKYFDLPGGEPYSTFQYSDAVFLNISYDKMRGAPKFVQKVLSRVSSRKWKIVYYHLPEYCTGYYDYNNKRKSENANKMTDVLDRFKVDLVFHGHTHIYERSFSLVGGKRVLDNSGRTYIVSGGGVGGQYPDRWTARMMPSKYWVQPHYQVMRVEGNELKMTSYAVRKSDEQIIENDYLVLTKNRSYPSKVLRNLKRARGQKALDLIRELGGLRHVPAAETVMKFLGSGSKDARRIVADALEKIASPKVAPKLLRYLGDRDVEVRRHIANAIGLTHPKGRLVAKLQRIVTDERQDEEVRIALIGGLQHGADPRVGKLLVTLVTLSKNLAVRQRAAYALKEMGGAKLGIKSELEAALNGAKDSYVKKCLKLAVDGRRKK